MNHLRRNFVLSLILFAAWVGALAVMAGVSGEPPRVKGVAAPAR